MSQSFNGKIINEGYTDLGTFIVDASPIKNPVKPEITPSNEPQPSRNNLFRLIDTEGNPLPDGLRVEFKIDSVGNQEVFTSYTSNEGFVGFNAPILPMVRRNEDGSMLIRAKLNPASYENRREECYIEVVDFMTDEGYYTLSLDLGLSSLTNVMGILGVYTDYRPDSLDTFYALGAGVGGVDTSVSALAIAPDGGVFVYDTVTSAWSSIGTLVFTQFTSPNGLVSVAEGIYQAVPAAGTPHTGGLGSGTFEKFSLSVENPVPYYYDVNVKVYEEGNPTPLYENKHDNLMPGDRNYIPITVEYAPGDKGDDSPTLDDIEEAGDFAFSSLFKDFLTTKNLTTLKSLAAAGPINYLVDVPTLTADDQKLQGYVDVFALTDNLAFAQRLISLGYDNVYDIANTPRSTFVSQVVDEDEPVVNVYRAGQIHYTGTQQLALLSDMVATAVTDFRLEENVYGAQGQVVAERSNFGEYLVSNYLSSCSCDDCKSGVSPFAYLTDLVKYAAHHISKTGSGAYTPTHYGPFLALLRNTFLQPFDSLPITCDTLHDEYCRIRLVAEVLEKLVTNTSGSISPARLAQLEQDRKDYLQVTYNTLLTQAGTSFNEVRDVYITLDVDDKKDKAQKLADKLGIPLYIPGSAPDLTTDRLWLSLAGTGNNELTAENLEEVFGFRDTQRNVNTATPESLMEEWRAAQLRNTWHDTDYPLTVYTREGVEGTGSGWVYQPQWMPIVDPDIMGPGDMSYLTDPVLRTLWENRQKNVDTELTHYTSDPLLSAETGADLQNRILRVYDTDISKHIIEDNKITLDSTVFQVSKRGLQGTDTDLYLKAGALEPVLLQPVTPTIQYRRKMKVLSHTAYDTSMSITVDDTTLFAVTSGYAKFESYAGNTLIGAYETTESPSSDWYLSVGTLGTATVSITLGSSTAHPEFIDGDLYFVYEVEVPLATDSVPDPGLLVDDLFTGTRTYSFIAPLAPGFSNPYSYGVWTVPSPWPAELDAATSYGKLKQMRGLMEAGESSNETYLDIIQNNLSTDVPSFMRMMTLLGVIETYLDASYTALRPSTDELYELASLFWVSSKKVLAPQWVKEEIEHDPAGGTDGMKLRLLSFLFSMGMDEVAAGAWDPGLQTIPASVGDIDEFVHKAIIDPERLARQNIQEGISQQAYFDIYDARQTQLAGKRDDYYGWLTAVPHDFAAFESILNDVHSGDVLMPHGIDLDALLTNSKSADAFVKEVALQQILTDFGMDGDTFAQVMASKTAYEDSSPSAHPTAFELSKTVRLLVTAFKIKQLYPTVGMTIGWLEEEVGGTNLAGVPVKYYNVLKMRMAPGRGDYGLRAEWQRTLAAWNACPVVEPDVVGAEDIRNFIVGNDVYDEWANFWNRLYAPSTAPQPGLYTQIREVLLDPSQTAADLWDAYRKLICWSFFSVDMSDPDILNDVVYFEAINERELAGEDIRPRLAYLGVTSVQYRSLRRVYEVMESTQGSGTIPLLDSEYAEVADAFVTILKLKQEYGFARLRQYDDDIILSGDEFKAYKPDVINFPLTELPVYNTARYPLNARKQWLDLLEARNDREQFSLDEWKTVLGETEDRTLRALRDALIRALGHDCEPFDATAERLAKTLFIETKDNCCAKHTRVSQAIETLQGFIFSLKSGIFDNYIAGFSLSAPNFEAEWEWLGSYATWRSAIFTYLYPENLLYPTLKRKQSPAFADMNRVLQDAARFTPDQACSLAKQYQDYFEDIHDLELKFTVSADCVTIQENVDACCEDVYQPQYTDFFFATAKTNGKHYWSSKLNIDNTGNSHTFWRELPVAADRELVGCFPLPMDRNPDVPGFEAENGLWLFYSYFDDGKLKMAYIKKPLDSLGDWGDETEAEEVPTEVGEGSLGQPYAVLACQSSLGWDWPSFVISYRNSGLVLKRNGGYIIPDLHIHLRYWDYKNKWEPISALNRGNAYVDDDMQRPIAAIRHSAGNDSGPKLYALSIVFADKVNVMNFTADRWSHELPLTGMQRVLGVFQSRASSSVVQVVYETDIQGDIKCRNITVAINTAQLTPPVISSPANVPMAWQVLQICPVFSQRRPATFGFNVYQDMCTSTVPVYPGGVLSFGSYLNLIPARQTSAPIQSADCITDFAQRILSVRSHMQVNLPAFTGSAVSYGTHFSPVIAECLREAYYFVPMLLALDQQARGQYDSALDWYRSVYDYTVSGNGSHRKVYYGLVMEENLQNIYTRPDNWLLDPLNPHLIAGNRANAYTKYTVMNIAQCLLAYADREFTLDTTETVPRARILYSTALELLGVKELKLAAGLCDGLVLCFPEAVSQQDASWQALFTVLQGQLSSLGNANAIAEAKENILDIFGEEGLDPLQQFSQSFQAIEDARESEPVQDLSTVVSGSAQRFNDMFRYMAAFPTMQTPLTALPQSSAGQFSWMMGNLLAVDASQIETEDSLARMAWLTTDRAFTEPYRFDFADSAGVQNLPGDKGYNPLYPTERSFTANTAYANATIFADTRVPLMPYTPAYLPLIDFRYCIPFNPVYSALQLKANLELYKIYNCRNIAGMVRELDVYAAPTDSTTGIPVIGAGGTLTLPGLSRYTPSQYRFSVLIDRAKQLVSQAQQMEALFLAAMEKRDAEYYSQLRARQDLAVAKSTVKLQDLRVNQANDERDMANLQLDKSNYSYQTYQTWISEGLSSFEQKSLDLLEATFALQYAAAGLNAAASAASAFTGGYSDILGFLAESSSAVAGGLATQSSYLAQMASFERRNEEWQYQSGLANFDISIAKQQVKISEDNIRIVSQEREIAQLNSDNAQDSLEFLKNKFTNAELYNWMSNVLGKSYSFMLNLATSVARTAEGQLYFERQEQSGPFILDDYWEAPGDSYAASGTGASAPDRRGLTGSARLLQDIYRLDEYAFDTDKRSLQLTKIISLAQNFPVEFQRFRETGVLSFELTNQLFDYDFPGHYMRLIRGVKTTVVGLVPVYGGVKATLTAEPTSYTVIGGNTFQRIPIKRLEIDSVALTSPNNATGMFELQPTQGPMLNPFEGMGVESRWEFKMPKFSNRLDYDQLADVVITVEYTAADSFQYRYQVLQELDTSFSFDRAFSFRNSFPDQWFDLCNAEAGTSTFGVKFNTRKEDFPQGFADIRFGGRMLLYFVREDGFTDEVEIQNFRYQIGTQTVTPLSGNTTNGVYTPQALSNQLQSGSPFRTWVLEFENSFANRALFSEGKIKDILFVITSVGDLPAYPL